MKTFFRVRELDTFVYQKQLKMKKLRNLNFQLALMEEEEGLSAEDANGLKVSYAIAWNLCGSVIEGSKDRS